ncbi:MAG TPA: TonB family protein, partial [Chryseosolibacter sp.]
MTKRQHDIERYLRGEMTMGERHALEKEALSDPFLADALEGAEAGNPDHFIFDVKELQSSIASRAGKRKPRIISLWNWSIGIAAGLILVAVSGIYVIQQVSERSMQQHEFAQNIDHTSLMEMRSNDTLEIVMPRIRRVAYRPVPMRIERIRGGVPTSRTEREVEANLTDPTVIEIQSGEAPVETVERGTAPALSLNVRTIKGVVTSAEDGSVLPGVNVVVKGTNTGTITDAEGKYEITVSQANQKLQFSFIGVKTVEAETRNKSSVNVSLTPDYESLSEVVVTGKAIDADENKTFNLAEPNGGKDAYTKYLEQKLVYPEQALKNEVEGRVTIQFTVEDNGSLSNFKVLNSLGFGCDEEAIRLIREGPSWSPSKKDNKAVAEEVKVSLK